MANELSIFVTYSTMLVDGNMLTNLLSIGDKTRLTGPDPPLPATAGGLDTHNVFEGDTSMTRADFAFGDNHSFNETLFQKFISFSNQFGAGHYNKTVAAELRLQLILDSLATNPSFSLRSPRSFTAYVEAVFPYAFFVDGRTNNGQLDMATAREFFQDARMPAGFHRRDGAFGFDLLVPDVGEIFATHPFLPGASQGLGNYVVDMSTASLAMPTGYPVCNMYASLAGVVVPSLYPAPTGALLAAIKGNMQNLFDGVRSLNCTQVFPYGP